MLFSNQKSLVNILSIYQKVFLAKKMAVRIITGPPGAGKTLNMTRLAIQEFNDNNSKFDIFLSKLKRRKYIYKNTIYSNYPILLKKDERNWLYYYDLNNNIVKTHEIYSNVVMFSDLRIIHKFCDNATFFIDEMQLAYDSTEYAKFPESVAHFFQIHRHLSYNTIYTNSQSISRVIKKVLVVAEEYWKIETFRVFFNKIARVKFRISYDLALSEESVAAIANEIDKVDYVTKYFLTKRVFNAYDTRYLSAMNDNLSIYDRGQWTSKKISKQEIIDHFFLSDEQKKELQKERF